MKGQFTIEYIGSAVFFLITLLGVAAIGAGKVPDFQSEVHEASLHLEAREITNNMLSRPGYHDYGAGGTNWDQNTATISNVVEFGLASDYLEVEMDKIENLSTVGITDFNYSQFKAVTKARHNYRFNFTWMPVIETYHTFVRGSPPTVDGTTLTEPTASSYPEADNIVHYGNITLYNREYKFLVTSHDGAYDTLYASSTWDFSGSSPRNLRETVLLGSNQLKIKSFQNLGKKTGTSVVLSKHLKTFGANIDRETTVIKMNRYAGLVRPGSELEPVKIEVWAW